FASAAPSGAAAMTMAAAATAIQLETPLRMTSSSALGNDAAQTIQAADPALVVLRARGGVGEALVRDGDLGRLAALAEVDGDRRPARLAELRVLGERPRVDEPLGGLHFAEDALDGPRMPGPRALEAVASADAQVERAHAHVAVLVREPADQEL